MTRGTRGSCLMGVDNLMRLLESMVVLTARGLLGTIGIISVRLWVYGLRGPGMVSHITGEENKTAAWKT